LQKIENSRKLGHNELSYFHLTSNLTAFYICGTQFSADQRPQMLINATCKTTFWVKKVKASHTRYRVLDLELIPVYRQSARGWL